VFQPRAKQEEKKPEESVAGDLQEKKPLINPAQTGTKRLL
jgi:hypothetical protein